jgi:thiosulfate reductase cytochrome b subunit
MNRADGTRGYLLRVGTGSVFLSAGDLNRLSTVIRLELAAANQFRFFARAIWLLILCALVWLLASAVTGPLFAYPWSN